MPTLAGALSSTHSRQIPYHADHQILIEEARLEPSALMCVLNVLASARIVCNIACCKCEVEIGKWSKVSVLLNQPHSNLVPRV
jgi:hypothetical protein